MCGIFGFNNPEESGKSEIFFSEMIHRGPDAQVLSKVDNWTLGHLRLSIIDTSSGANQPFEKDGNFIVFNGEIYNYLELKEKYLGEVKLKTSSDTEVLIELLNRFGKKILNELNGMFAFAWYNKATKEVLLVRDRFGVKPLYWLSEDSNFYFSSEIKPLIKIKKNFAFNSEILRTFMRDTATDYDENTFVEGIFSIKPGFLMLVGENRVGEAERWYNGNDFSFDKNIFSSQEKTRDFFEDLLTSAIGLRHRADVPACITLSGGLDSTTIYVLAKEKIGSKLKPFTFSHAGSNTDETAKAKRLAREYGDEPIIVESNHQEGIESLKEALYYLEFPNWNPSAIAYLDMYKAIKSKGYKVIIEGHGSDEQLGGYPYMIEAAWKELLLRGRWKQAYEIFKVYKATLNPSLDQSIREKGSFYDFVVMARGLTRGIIKTILSPTKAKYLNMRALVRDAFDYKILPIVLRTFDRLTMSQSLESRSPFMDYRVVEFLRALPLEYMVSSIGSKALLREILKKYGKDYIYQDKNKMGFASDLPAFLNNKDNKSFFAEMIDKFNLEGFAQAKKSAQDIIKKDNISWGDVDMIWKVASLEAAKEMYEK